MMLKAFMVLWWALLVFGVPGGIAQEAPPAAPSKEIQPAEKPVMLGDEILFQLATEAEGFSQAKRASEISKRIRRIADSPRFQVDSITTNDFSAPMTLIVAGDEIVTAVLDEDAASKGKSRQELAVDYARIIRSAIEKYRRDRSIEQRVYGAIFTLIATIVLIAALIVIGKLKHKLQRFIDERFSALKSGIKIQSLEIIRADKVDEFLKVCLKGISVILTLVFFYIYLQLVLGFFPSTRSIADRILGYILSPLAIIGEGFIDQLPNLLFITVLILLGRYILKVAKIFFLGIEQGRVKLPGFYPEWSKSTYRLFSFLVIAFFVIIAFPYIPGSDSLAFKGVSVFAGVLFSLGAQSTVSNMVAGFALTYRRAFRLGDLIKIDDLVGFVQETRLQVTILRTPKNEEIILPNSLILNSHVINYSAEALKKGLILYTSVTIGYDTPWRQVHALLLMAAQKTPGLLTEPTPFVLQKSLDDFYVTYELNVYCDKPELMAGFYSELHQNILDVFNEYGVQILSPNYEGDKAEPAIVPKERWYAPPAKPSDAGKEHDLPQAK